jgi:hypothetical protein
LVASTVSTLALQLQRVKPHEWNELIQVVLQGLMLARSAAPSEKVPENGASPQGGAGAQPDAQTAARRHKRQVPAEIW